MLCLKTVMAVNHLYWYYMYFELLFLLYKKQISQNQSKVYFFYVYFRRFIVH